MKLKLAIRQSHTKCLPVRRDAPAAAENDNMALVEVLMYALMPDGRKPCVAAVVVADDGMGHCLQAASEADLQLLQDLDTCIHGRSTRVPRSEVNWKM